jgi:CHAT domain-containing protein
LRAGQSAEAAEDHRSASHALGNLGALYGQEGGREGEALYLTRRALELAEGEQAADLMARWHAQSGRLHWRAGRVEEALADYRRAVGLLGETRPEASAGYGSADAAFREAVEPVYLALVDALLQSSESLPEGRARQGQLAEAREVVEKWKAAELRNYFRDSCAAEFAASARALEGVDPRAAIVYPIVLEDRLELLVSSARGIGRYTLPVSRLRLREEVMLFRLLLQRRSTEQYLRPAQQLYKWLVAPYLGELAGNSIDTLVFVPGGALRTIPLAALHDGESFLIDRYAVAVTPSLNLIAPEPLEPEDTELLLAGVSESVQGFPALAGVSGEISAIEDLYGGEVLLDAAFTQAPLETALREKRPGIVHLASHAKFTGDPETSFIMTHDSRISMERLAELLRWGRYGEEPVELLLLSACETASGDERAALGLAGIAVRAGARSAMGSLWPVSDAATAGLVVDFYEALGERGLSKAHALQRAQQQLREQQGYQHPFFWAPFVVINNWL